MQGAAKNPTHVDGPMPELTECPEPAAPKPPVWWEVPSETATAEDIKAMLRRNLEELEKRRSKAPGGWKRAVYMR